MFSCKYKSAVVYGNSALLSEAPLSRLSAQTKTARDKTGRARDKTLTDRYKTVTDRHKTVTDLGIKQGRIGTK